MSTYTDQILGTTPSTETPDLFSTQINALEKQFHKPKKRKKDKSKKKLKKLEKQFQVMALEHQRIMELEEKRHKKKKGKKGKKKLKKKLRALELQRQQRPPLLQEVLASSVPKVLDLMIASKNAKSFKSQPSQTLKPQHSLALPASWDNK